MMNLVAEAKLSARLISHSPSSAKRFFYPHPFTALHHSDFFSTKPTPTIHKTQTLPNPTIHNSTQTIKKQAVAPPAVWPKPQPIVYQAKVANSVNLIGIVNVPVKPVSYGDGRYVTAIVISLGSLSIPVVFEGDLAHAVASHVKVNDCVSVFGQLSVDPLLNESVGKFHVLAENICFVVGFDKTSVLDGKLGLSSSAAAAVAVENDEFGKFSSKNHDYDDDDDGGGVVVDYIKVSRVEIDEFGKFRSKNDDDDDDDGVVVNYNKVSRVEFDGGKGKSSCNERPPVTLFGVEALPLPLPQSMIGNNGSWKKDPNEILDLWSDVVKNPLQWWDYRGHKANGLVKEKFPDFKHKETGEALWISSCPKWMLPEFRRLKFDVKEMKPRQNSDHEDSWKNLVENPEKWWDNRAKKQNLKSPDFRHKETGEGLWLNRSPGWVLSKLPNLRIKHSQILKS